LDPTIPKRRTLKKRRVRFSERVDQNTTWKSINASSSKSKEIIAISQKSTKEIVRVVHCRQFCPILFFSCFFVEVRRLARYTEEKVVVLNVARRRKRLSPEIKEPYK